MTACPFAAPKASAGLVFVCITVQSVFLAKGSGNDQHTYFQIPRDLRKNMNISNGLTAENLNEEYNQNITAYIEENLGE